MVNNNIAIEEKRHWHFNKEIPVSLMLLILFQTATLLIGGLLMLQKLDYRVTLLEHNDSINQQINASFIKEKAKVDIDLSYIKKTLSRIERNTEKNSNTINNNRK